MNYLDALEVNAKNVLNIDDFSDNSSYDQLWVE